MQQQGLSSNLTARASGAPDLKRTVSPRPALFDSSSPFSKSDPQRRQRYQPHRPVPSTSLRSSIPLAAVGAGSAFNATGTLRSLASHHTATSAQQRIKGASLSSTAGRHVANTTTSDAPTVNHWSATTDTSLSAMAEYAAAADLLSSFVARRRVLEKAAELATSMNEQASDVAEQEARSRLLAGGGAGGGAAAKTKAIEAIGAGEPGHRRGFREGFDTGKSRHYGNARPRGYSRQARRAQQQQQRFLSENGIREGDADRNRSTGVSIAALEGTMALGEDGGAPGTQGGDGGGITLDESAMSEAENLRKGVLLKCEKLDYLRGIQRTIADLDDVADEKRRGAEKTAQQQRQTPSERTVGTPLTSLSLAPADLERDNADDTSASAAAALESARAARADLESSQLRSTFYAMIKKNDEEGLSAEDMVAPPPPPSPPSRFTSTALAVTLEALGDSLAALVEVTDNVCVLSTFKARDEQVHLLPHMQSLLAHVVYSRKAHQLCMRHLERYTSGEKALLEGGAFEVNSLREQFLLRKEALTAQEQREKQAEDARNALRTRLQVLIARTCMWEEVLLGRRTREIQQRASMSARASMSRGRSGSPALSAQHDHTATLAWLPPSRRTSLQRGTSIVHAKPVDRSTPDSLWKGERGEGWAQLNAAEGLPSSTSRLPPPAEPDSHCAVPRESIARAAEDDALERRLALKWGNPYILKMMQWEQQQNQTLVHQKDASGTIGGGEDSESGEWGGQDGEYLSATSQASGEQIATDAWGGRFSPIPKSFRGSPGSFSANGCQRTMSFSRWLDETGNNATGASSFNAISAASRATAEARLLSLLQSLLRTIPAVVYGADASEPANADASVTVHEVCKADQEVRLSTRESIHRLIRHLQQVIAKDKSDRSGGPVGDVSTV